jgi:RNA polymerase sigma-70 factor (ECF subfamily)
MDGRSSSFRSELILLLPRLRRFGHALTGSADAADDLVQDALERAMRRQAQYEPGTRLDSWMYRMMQTIWIDERRKQTVRRQHAPSLPDVVKTHGEDGRISFSARIELEDVRKAMLLLPDDCRAVLALVSIDGLSYSEAAEALAIPAGTVMSRLSRARRLLIAILDSSKKDVGGHD